MTGKIMKYRGFSIRKRKRRLGTLNDFHEEWWSAYLLLATGFYTIFFPEREVLHQSMLGGFAKFLPIYFWETLFLGTGVIQYVSLRFRMIKGRVLAALLASILLMWAFLNLMIYEPQWHVSVFAWGIFACMNLYTLSHVLTELRERYEHF